jgi:hypothetical protein
MPHFVTMIGAIEPHPGTIENFGGVSHGSLTLSPLGY